MPRRWPILAVLAFGACGRVGYDALAGDGGPGADGAAPGDGPAGDAPPAPPRFVGDSDLTGDGVDDLVVQSSGGSLWIFAGGPGFGPAGPGDAFASLGPDSACAPAGPWALADLDRDGRTDLLGVIGCGAAGRIARIPGPVGAGAHSVGEFPSVDLPAEAGGLRPGQIAIGDFTGDGRRDLVLGFASGLDGAGVATGIVTVHSDALERGPPEVTRLASYAVLDGEAMADEFGVRLEAAGGDVTGDGLADLLVGAYRADATGVDSGASYVFAAPLPPGRRQANDVAHARILGQRAGALAGVGAAIGDLDRDGALDVLVGADEDTGGGAYAGRVFVFLGPLAPGVRDTAAAARYVSGGPYDEYGTILNMHGDVNGDGALDLLVHGCCASDGGLSGVGVLAGVFAASPFTSRTPANVDFVIKGDATGDHWGNPSVPGDLDGDGTDDFAVGLAGWGAGRGGVYVFLGGATIASGKAGAVASMLVAGTLGTADGFGARVVGR